MKFSYTILSTGSVRFVCGNSEAVVPHAVFTNINDSFLFGAEAKAASRIWPNRPCGRLDSVLLAGLSGRLRRRVISEFLVWAAANTANSEVRFFVLPMTLIREYGVLFKELAQEIELNIRLITYLELLMQANDEHIALGDGELGLFIYESYESAEAIFVSHGEEGRLTPMKALFSPYVKHSGLFARILEMLAERLPQGTSSVKLLKVWSNRSWDEALSRFKAEVTSFKALTAERLNRLKGKLPEERLDTLFRRHDLFAQESAERLSARLPEGHPLASLVYETIRAYDTLSFEQREFLIIGLQQAVANAAEIDESYRQGLMKIFLQKKGGKLKVGVVSPFSYGKSTLLNAFLGFSLLKDDIRAETANITHITRGHRYTLMLEQNQSSVARVFDSLEPMRQFLHEHTSVREHGDGIDRVHAALPMSELNEHIEWVDTPGLFGRHAHHDKITDQVIPELDVILFLIDPKKVGHSHYGEKIYKYSQGRESRCLFVIGKMDLYPDDAEKLTEDLRASLPDRLQSVPIFTVSGYLALMARLAQKGVVPLEQLQKDQYIYAQIGEQIYSGRTLTKEHLPAMLDFSGLTRLERYIRSKTKHMLERRRQDELNHIL